MWLLGLIYLIVGFVIALWGVNLFPFIGASMVAIFTITVTCSLTEAFGWMDTTWGCTLCFILALTLGIVFGCVIRRNIWLLIALTGLIGGFFSGALIDSAIVASTEWNPVWFYWFISCLMGAIGCLLSCYFGKALVMVATSGIGSYLFMRSWTLFYPGHYPSEADLWDENNTYEYDNIFWVFVAVFVVCWPLSMLYQYNFTKQHAELEEYGVGSKTDYQTIEEPNRDRTDDDHQRANSLK